MFVRATFIREQPGKAHCHVSARLGALGAGAVVCTLMAIALAASPAIAGGQLPRSVVIIGQEDPILPWNVAVSTVSRETLNTEPNRRVITYAEDLDFTRFGGERYKRQLQLHFREKYRFVPVGAILAFGPAALEFVVSSRDSIWPDVPIVFGAVAEDTVAKTKLPKDVTGRTVRFHLEDMVRSARAIVPNLQHVVLVGDPFERSAYFANFAREVPELSKSIDFIDLTGLPLGDVQRKVAQLPAQAAIAYTAIHVDGNGYNYFPREALEQIAQVANRPIVIPAETYFGYGGVGGMVAVPVPIAEDAAQLVLRILDGESPAALPIARGDYTKPMFDWRQLTRWGVKEARLPEGSEILFRQPSFWEQYRGLALGGAGIIAVQATLITGLILERRRRSKAEAEARRSLAEVAHMNRRAGIAALSASIAHELNQPLGAILSNAEAAELLLDRQPLDLPVIKEVLADIRRSDQRAADIITHMRELLRKNDSEPLEIDLNDVIRHVVELLTPEARLRGISVSTLLDPRRLTVRANAVHLQQVVLNLALNGMEAMRDSVHGERRLTIRTGVANDAHVEVAVSDTGSGLPPDMLNRVFEPFFSTKQDGIGLGLSIARTIIERLGGTISAENRPGGGATFRFILPSVMVSSSAVLPAANAKKVQPAKSVTPEPQPAAT
jgi:signal transduction histidine kinase